MKKVGILGATGFTGIELLRILNNHPQIEISFATSESFQGKKISEVFPSLKLKKEIVLQPFDDNLLKSFFEVDLVFIAYPSGKATEIAPLFLKKGIAVIDLSADFRLKEPALFKKWYRLKPPESKYLAQSVYGLPEFYREKIKRAKLVANPGCYPTGVLLSLVPLLKEGLIKGEIIIDAKSGVSGAGRTPKETNIFCYCHENFMAYSVEGHRHQVEIEQELFSLTKRKPELVFQTHLLPANRGIFLTIYAILSKRITSFKIREIYQKYYQAEKFIRLLPPEVWPATKDVFGSNFFDLNFVVRNNKNLLIFSVLDNLVKGASGQAVQNMNLVFGFEESLGLEQLPVYP